MKKFMEFGIHSMSMPHPKRIFRWQGPFQLISQLNSNVANNYRECSSIRDGSAKLVDSISRRCLSKSSLLAEAIRETRQQSGDPLAQEISSVSSAAGFAVSQCIVLKNVLSRAESPAFRLFDQLDGRIWAAEKELALSAKALEQDKELVLVASPYRRTVPLCLETILRTAALLVEEGIDRNALGPDKFYYPLVASSFQLLIDGLAELFGYGPLVLSIMERNGMLMRKFLDRGCNPNLSSRPGFLSEERLLLSPLTLDID
ncbi:hypothetical protein M501DRAFT_1031066 [Patellaria atrata CBS 101060]|uniref:Uncharacterized protein n=1 Tax=Patellaria atrata CBS 101060 TaxID=1346257 RepID=A0A9P4VNL9_9PEZI|nr:hypothetical protein M501DRAFT_1031066 [Patellaria atrata CBS 101060]